jgi:hypothetical protein
MQLLCDIDGAGIRSEKSTFYRYDGEAPPDRFDTNDKGFQEYRVMEITATNPIQELPVVDPVSGTPGFPSKLKIKMVGGSLQVTATPAIDGEEGREAGELILPQLESVDV